VLLSTVVLWAFGVIEEINVSPRTLNLRWMKGNKADGQFGPYTLTVALSAVLEAMSDQNDNLILPMFGWAIGTLLGV
jgi:hypothetical protein